MSSARGLAELLRALAEVLSTWTDRWYLFGAQAVQVWGTPRLTGDVDVTAEFQSRDPVAFVTAMQEAGFELRVRDIAGFVKRTRVLPFVHRESNIPVDVVLAGPGLEEEFLKRAIPVNIGGTVLPVISPEDLIVTKIVAGRPKDIEDVRGILRERLGRLDSRRIRRTLVLLAEAIAQTDLVPLFEHELSRARLRNRKRRSQKRFSRPSRKAR